MGESKTSIKKNIRVSFPWNSAESVAGSQVLIEIGSGQEKRNVLVECGLVQGSPTPLDEYRDNKKKFGFKSKDIDYVFVCHMHTDHIGLVPRLHKEGSVAPIIMPEGSRPIYLEMIQDSAKIMEKNSEYLTKKFKKNYDPIYTIEEAERSNSFIEEYPKHQKIKLDDYISFEFENSGHIIHSCQLILWVTWNNVVKKIVITSDLGNKSIPSYYVEPFVPIESGSLLIGETTYSNPSRCCKPKDREKDLEKLYSSITTVCNDRMGSVLIPAFSLHRFQTILTHLYDLFKDRDDCPNIYAASPLAGRISEIFSYSIENDEEREKWREVRKWEKIKFISEFSNLEEAVARKEPCVYVASAGMINAGSSQYIAKELLPGSNNMIIFCGYMAPNTLGYKIKQKNTKTINIEGVPYKARCDVIALKSFSSHMTHDDLLDYYSGVTYDKIALVHGEMEDKVRFRDELEEEVSKRGRTTKIICVNKSTSILL